MKSKLKFLLAFIFLMLMLTNVAFADDDATTTASTCTHTVYDDNETSTYHYKYCEICGKCNYRSKHIFSYSKYNDTSHIAKCSCGYKKIVAHDLSAVKINNGESIKGKTYQGEEELDEYHKLVCKNCGYVYGVEKHTWTRAEITLHMNAQNVHTYIARKVMQQKVFIILI